jgi:hypothetical protein
MINTVSPPTGWTKIGTIPFVSDGIRNYYQFGPTTTTQTFQSSGVGQVLKYGSRNGATHIICVRITKADTLTPATPQTFSCPSGSGAIMTLLYNNLFGLWQSQTQNFPPPLSYAFGRNAFVFYALVMPNTPKGILCYLNDKYYSKGTVSPPGMVDATLASGNYTFKNPDLTGGTAFDLLYFAHYDRPLVPNQISRIYNSIAPLLDVGPIAPIYTSPSSFTSLNIPGTPILQWNAFSFGLTNGASYNGAGGWGDNGIQQMNMVVDSAGRNYLSFTNAGETLVSSYTISPKMFTNGGMTFAFLMSVNSLANERMSPVKILSIGAVADFYLSYVFPSGLSQAYSLLVGLDEYDGQLPGDCSSCPQSALTSYLGQYKLYIYNWNTTFSTLYVNNQIVVSGNHGNGLSSGADKTSLNTSVQFGFLNQAGITGNSSFDLSYFGFWDRSLTSTEMNALYASCSMLLE